MFSDIYLGIQQDFKRSWFKFLIWNSALAKLFFQEETPSIWDFFTNYLSSWLWTRFWFRFFISDDNLSRFDNIFEIIQILKNNGLFNEDNCVRLSNDLDLKKLASALNILKSYGILTQDNFSLLVAHDKLTESADIINYLDKARILTQGNFSLLIANAHPDRLYKAIIFLFVRNILTQRNFDIAATITNNSHLEIPSNTIHFQFPDLKDGFFIAPRHANIEDLSFAYNSYNLSNAP